MRDPELDFAQNENPMQNIARALHRLAFAHEKLARAHGDLGFGAGGALSPPGIGERLIMDLPGLVGAFEAGCVVLAEAITQAAQDCAVPPKDLQP